MAAPTSCLLVITSPSGWKLVIPNQEVVTVAQKLVDQMFCHFSAPEDLYSDQGKQFESIVMQAILSSWGFKKTRTSPYHPQ